MNVDDTKDETLSAPVPSSSSPSSPSTTQKLQELLAKYHASADDTKQHWWSNIEFALDSKYGDEIRRHYMVSFVDHPVFRNLVKELLDHIDELPRSFTDQVFDRSKSSSPLPRPRMGADRLLADLKDAKLDCTDPAHCLETVLRHLHKPLPRRPVSSLTMMTPVADFTSAFFGPSLILLQDHITVHNELFPHKKHDSSPDLVHIPNPTQNKTAWRDYTKVLPIIQSSGFGKTRMCVQLSTISPGMLVCLRESSIRTVHHHVSFPPQDSHVYSYFEASKALLSSIDFPVSAEQHAHFNRAHLHVCAWLAMYCSAIASYLERLKASAGCFSSLPCGPASHERSHPNGLCWKTVVYHLAAVIHSSSEDFVPHSLFDPPDLCPESQLHMLAQQSKDATTQAPTRQTPAPSSSTTEAKKEEKPVLPDLFTTPNLRTQLLKFICDSAEALYKDMCTKHSSAMSQPEHMLQKAIKTNLTSQINRLEACVPNGFHQPFFFLALDECGSMATLLPVIRRVWFHARPQRSWILLIDTNSDLAPLAGEAARKGSRRTDRGSTHRLTQPFSTMPLDVNVAAETRQRIFADRNTFTLEDLNRLLPKLGRPLWNDQRYHDQHGIIDPQVVITKLVSPGDWTWDINQKIPHESIAEVIQNLLALASRRINLELTSRSSPQLWYNFVSTQIAQHLRFVGRIFTTSDSIISNTPSEPPLSAAVAWFFRCEPKITLNKWQMVIQAIASAIETIGFDVGAQGEQGVALLCSMAIDLAAVDKYANDLAKSYSESSDVNHLYPALFGLVSVRDWLKNLISDIGRLDSPPLFTPQEDNNQMQLESDEAASSAPDAARQLAEWSDRAWLNFKHIVRLEEQLPIKDVMDPDYLAELWVRQAAAQGISNQPGWDLLIPVYESSTPAAPDDKSEAFDKSKLSYVAVQVKNCIKFPTEKLKEPVGPRLASSELKQCLEIFVDLKGKARHTGPILSQRRHTAAESTAEAKQADTVSQLLRHHLLVTGLDAITFPILDKLVSPASDQVCLLFGNTNSRDTIDFDRARAAHVRQQDPAHQVAWDEAQVRISGALVDLQLPSDRRDRKRKRKQHTRA
ncbi:uncharacterized protein UTRI_10161 [Ustilago trichophora]|uniref:Uncharacterized protein n=1 Tax=Ustilago trichophora TaxID=86804 RepID=A0A5C3EB80_9BASI|nr:uncharacterized protein UTRI_10161 [Ustilago trichophora]